LMQKGETQNLYSCQIGDVTRIQKSSLTCLLPRHHETGET